MKIYELIRLDNVIYFIYYPLQRRLEHRVVLVHMQKIYLFQIAFYNSRSYLLTYYGEET